MKTKYFLFHLLSVMIFYSCGAPMHQNTPKTPIYSHSQMGPNCKPKRSNDCRLHDAFVLPEPKLHLEWNDLQIDASQLPQNSWYKITEESETAFTFIVYPHVGEHYILGSHDFEIHVLLKKRDAKTESALTVVKANEVSDDFSDITLQNGGYDITISQRLNYSYEGEPQSNPNPFTREVITILKTVMENIVFSPKK